MEDESTRGERGEKQRRRESGSGGRKKRKGKVCEKENARRVAKKMVENERSHTALLR